MVVIFVFYKKVKLMIDVYFLNMVIVDIFFVFIFLFWVVYYVIGEWIFSNVMCKLIRGIYIINFNCGMLFLIFISIDRYVVIV